MRYTEQMQKEVRRITKDTANAIVRGDQAIPVYDIGLLLEYIEHLEIMFMDRPDYDNDDPTNWGE